MPSLAVRTPEPAPATLTPARPIICLGMDVHKDSITIAVLPAPAKGPTRLDKRPNDLPKRKQWMDRVARDGEIERETGVYQPDQPSMLPRAHGVPCLILRELSPLTPAQSYQRPKLTCKGIKQNASEARYRKAFVKCSARYAPSSTSPGAHERRQCRNVRMTTPPTSIR
ncbi:hypothetical protein BH09GEM1_BH09GEM1_10490 [soil metagenome]